MKYLKKLLVVTVTTFTLFYLTGCLAQVSFNIAEWSDTSRQPIFGLALLTVLIITLAMAVTNQLND